MLGVLDVVCYYVFHVSSGQVLTTRDSCPVYSQHVNPCVVRDLPRLVSGSVYRLHEYKKHYRPEISRLVPKPTPVADLTGSLTEALKPILHVCTPQSEDDFNYLTGPGTHYVKTLGLY